MTLPPFPGPILRACTLCGASVYLTSWRQRCDKCGGLIVDEDCLDALDAGIKVVVRVPEK